MPSEKQKQSQSTPGESNKQDKKFAPWQKIPRLINTIKYHLGSNLSQNLDYEPMHLMVFSNVRYTLFENNNYQQLLSKTGDTNHLIDQLAQDELDLNGFKMALEQVPGVRTIEFSGRGEHCQNPDFFNMAQLAYQTTDAMITLNTDGLMLEKNLDALFNAGLQKINIRLYAHRPSTYYQMSGLDSRHFVEAERQTQLLIAERNKRQHPLKVALTMMVDDHHYTETEDMINFANSLGADELVLENFVQNVKGQSDRTMYSDQSKIVKHFKGLQKQLSLFEPLTVKLPILLNKDMSQHRHCSDPYTLVGLDGQCNVTPCSKQAFPKKESSKIWDPDFWNSQSYQWLRGIHGDKKEAVPLPCQYCVNNIKN